MSQGSPQRSPRRLSDGDKRPRLEFVVNPDECWFCLGNTRVDRALLACIGQHAYVTLAKGPVVDNHVIVLPIKHIEKFYGDTEVSKEVCLFTTTIMDYFNSCGKDFIMIERCFKAPHAQIECMPIDREIVANGTLEKALTELAQKKHLVIQVINTERYVGSAGWMKTVEGHYFYMKVISGSKSKGYLVPIKEGMPFPVNFGREAIAIALGIPQKSRWQDCVEDDATVQRKVKEFKDGYGPFNFTLQQ